MQILLLGYGKEGKSSETYFQNQGNEITVLDNFTNSDLEQIDATKYDLILRSPSVHPQAGWSSMTKYFFDHCPCPVIGVTGTKGKGTTCSIITAILQELGQKVWLVGNIGTPALDVLDKIQPQDVVVYEMSSFQLWDLEKSPHIAVVLRIEPDHLNIHDDFADYVNAKANITAHQSSQDYCIYNQQNSTSSEVAQKSAGTKLPYPITTKIPLLEEVLSVLNIPGEHNRENTEAALLAVSTYYDKTLDELLSDRKDEIKNALAKFKGLPHRLEFVRELNQVKYFDDNFCTNTASLEVALKAFPRLDIVSIIGGRDKTDNEDLPEIIKLVREHSAYTILIGESGHAIAKTLQHSAQIAPDKYTMAETLEDAVLVAKQQAEKLVQSNYPAIVLMSPAAASFDMFENVYDRGSQFQNIVRKLH